MKSEVLNDSLLWNIFIIFDSVLYIHACVDATVNNDVGVTRGYKDGLQPESLADGNWLVKQNQPVSKIETKSDTNLRSLYES
jgi:hypothetical protein